MATKTTMAVTMADMVAAVRAYAVDHYDNGQGWDYVVEAYGDDELADIIGGAWTTRGAIWKVYARVSLLASARADVMGA